MTVNGKVLNDIPPQIIWVGVFRVCPPSMFQQTSKTDTVEQKAAAQKILPKKASFSTSLCPS